MPHLYPTQFRLLEEEVEFLLDKYADRWAPIDVPPVPVEIIAERLLKLRCEITNLGRFGKDVFGALLADQRRILIEESCTDSQYYFTLAHEIGHWRLHVPRGETNRFVDTSHTLSAILRSTTSRSGSEKSFREEIEANRYAAALLIPQSLIIPAASNYQVINAGAVYQLAAVFQTSAMTVLYRLYYLERNLHPVGPSLDRDSLYALEDKWQKGLGS